MTSRLPVVAECAQALQDAGMPPMGSAQLGSCMAAKALVEAMRRSKKPADAKSLLSAMQSLAKQDIGGFTVNCGPGQNHGSKFVELAMVSRGGKLKN